jgi:predicted DNA-binding transcriptional regulator AlpA
MSLLTAKEVSVAWQIPVSRVYELARSGYVPCVRLKRQIRFDEGALRDWISRGGESIHTREKERERNE